MIVHAQAIRRHVLRFGDRETAAQLRARWNRRQVSYPVRAVIQGIAHALQAHHRANEERCERERHSPWAMVVPPGNSLFARSWSTWIHCSSQDASANWLIRSCETSIQSLAPISMPMADLTSLKSLNIRMFVTWSDLHFGDGVGNNELGVRYGHDLGDADVRCGFQQRRFT